MDSAINMHLAITKLQDSMRAAQSARVVSAVPRPAPRRRVAWLATAWHDKRGTHALPHRGATAAVSPRPNSPLEA
jgi:hypothetical protein